METKVIITGNGYTALVPNGSFPPQHGSLSSPAWPHICCCCARPGRGCARTGDDGEINTNMNQLWSLQTPRTLTDKHTAPALPGDREGRGQSCSPGLCQGAGGFASLRDYYYYYWVYFYIELPTKCKDLLSGFYLIVAYFCTVYRLTVTFEQLSKYSNIYRAGREGTRGTGTAQAGSVWGVRSEPGAQGCSVKAQAWRYRGTGGNVQQS